MRAHRLGSLPDTSTIAVGGACGVHSGLPRVTGRGGLLGSSSSITPKCVAMTRDAKPAPTGVSRAEQPFYTIADLAVRWRCSRASVYSTLRGELVVALRPGRKGRKLVSADVVRQIENRRTRRLT